MKPFLKILTLLALIGAGVGLYLVLTRRRNDTVALADTDHNWALSDALMNSQILALTDQISQKASQQDLLSLLSSVSVGGNVDAYTKTQSDDRFIQRSEGYSKTDANSLFATINFVNQKFAALPLPIKGDKGDTGQSGSRGIPGTQIKAYSLNGDTPDDYDLAEVGNLGDFIFDSGLVPRIWGPKISLDTWLDAHNVYLTGPKGDAGDSGSEWLYSAGVPVINQGKIKDFHVNTDTGEVRNKTADGWGNPIMTFALKPLMDTAITNLIGGADADYNTLGKLESQLKDAYNISSAQTGDDGTVTI